MLRRVSLAMGFLIALFTIGALAAGGAHTQGQTPSSDEASLTPQERMERRFPQKVRAGDLVGLPLLDDDDRTLGYVRQVVRTADGRIVLVTLYGSWFGWGGRPVGVPLETVAILGRQIAVLDIPRVDFPGLATWTGAGDMPVGADEMLRIAITRR